MNFLDLNDDVKFIFSKHLQSDSKISTMRMFVCVCIYVCLYVRMIHTYNTYVRVYVLRTYVRTYYVQISPLPCKYMEKKKKILHERGNPRVPPCNAF